METSIMQWERIELARKTNSRPLTSDTIWLRGDKNKIPSVLCIAGNICREARLQAGDPIWLYKQGNTFMIRKEPSDFKLRSTGKTTETLCLSSKDFVSHLYPHINGNEYDAWVENGNIIFRPKKQ